MRCGCRGEGTDRWTGDVAGFGLEPSPEYGLLSVPGMEGYTFPSTTMAPIDDNTIIQILFSSHSFTFIYIHFIYFIIPLKLFVYLLINNKFSETFMTVIYIIILNYIYFTFKLHTSICN